MPHQKPIGNRFCWISFKMIVSGDLLEALLFIRPLRDVALARCLL